MHDTPQKLEAGTVPATSPQIAELPSSTVPPPSQARAGDSATEGTGGDEITLLELANALLRRWRVVAGLPIGTALLTAALSLLIPPVYTATTTFAPEASSQNRLPAGLTGLVGQLGISIASDAVQSPRFYAEVVQSRGLMEQILRARYPYPRSRPTPSDSATLLQILNVQGTDSAARIHNGVRELGDLVAVEVDAATNILRLSMDSRYPELAAEVANRFVVYLNEFNAKTRQSQARERRRFTEERVMETERDLRRAEEAVEDFYERNRSWQQSPQLVFEELRLRRQVDIRQEIYLTLRREYETARVEEVNDTPIITVIDVAVPPHRRSKPRRRLLVLLALVLGTLTGIFWAFGAEYLGRVRREDERDYREFRGLVRRIRDEIRSVPRKLVRKR